MMFLTVNAGTNLADLWRAPLLADRIMRLLDTRHDRPADDVR
jgi:hypothetical protein